MWFCCLLASASRQDESSERLINSGCHCRTRPSCTMQLNLSFTRLMIDYACFVHQPTSEDSINMSTALNIYFTVFVSSFLPFYHPHPPMTYERHPPSLRMDRSTPNLFCKHYKLFTHSHILQLVRFFAKILLFLVPLLFLSLSISCCHTLCY